MGNLLKVSRFPTSQREGGDAFIGVTSMMAVIFNGSNLTASEAVIFDRAKMTALEAVIFASVQVVFFYCPFLDCLNHVVTTSTVGVTSFSNHSII